MTETDFYTSIIDLRPYCVNLAAKYVGRADSEDIVQVAYTKVWEARESLVLDAPGCLRRLLSTVVSNESRNVLRERKALKRVRPAWMRGRGYHYQPPTQLARLELAEALESFPEELTPILTGMKYNELARSLNVPIGTIKSRLSRARLQPD